MGCKVKGIILIETLKCGGAIVKSGVLDLYSHYVLLQWFEEKLQEVESADQQFRKLHTLVESLVVHRKG